MPLGSVQTVTANVGFGNLASIRVLRKCGMTLCAQNQQEAAYHIRRTLPGSARFRLGRTGLGKCHYREDRRTADGGS